MFAAALMLTNIIISKKNRCDYVQLVLSFSRKKFGLLSKKAPLNFFMCDHVRYLLMINQKHTSVEKGN